MNVPTPTITVDVDPTNPGQFFACCGILELAQRLWPATIAEGWFAKDGLQFHVACGGGLADFTNALANAELTLVNGDDPYSSPVKVSQPFRPISLDWWAVEYPNDARDLKVWAGTMESYGIAYAMQCAIRGDAYSTTALFDVSQVISVPGDEKKKKEPYYFDSRRAPNAHSRDVGFSPNDLSMTTLAYPAVELLCLIGLQVARPKRIKRTRIHEYAIWSIPLMNNLLLTASSGAMGLPGHQKRFRFESWFRTGQKKHKAFRQAIPLTQGEQ